MTPNLSFVQKGMHSYQLAYLRGHGFAAANATDDSQQIRRKKSAR